ncbi:MAG: carboxypeptidase-like regulatory domain-containing protein [Winogradskyella sp.]
MKNNLFFISFICTTFLCAQIKINGKVLNSANLPLENVTIYLNNTSIGTVTNKLGEFELSINEGIYDLVISYMGYETLKYKINTSTYAESLKFYLKPALNLLDETIIKSKRYSAEDMAYFLSRFKMSFIGETQLAENCKILNPDVIKFDFDLPSKTLEAYANKPIEIENKDLGYKIYYELLDFVLTNETIVYSGYSRYETLRGGKRKKNYWRQNRLKAYNGSKMHFVRSAILGTLHKEGFVIDQSKKVLNPHRPADSVINAARERFRWLKKNSSKKLKTRNFKIKTRLSNKRNTVNSKGNSFLKIFKPDSISEKEIDTLMTLLKKRRLKKFIDIKLNEDLNEDAFLVKSNNEVRLKFEYQLDIKYINEAEEDGYRPGPGKLNYQESKLTLLTESVLLDKTGIFNNEASTVFTYGYWSYERIADALPLNFIPVN